MNTFVHIVWAIANSVWQSAIVGAVAWIALLGVRRTAAAVRYAVWCTVLLAAVALPVVNIALKLHVVAAPAPQPAVVTQPAWRAYQVPPPHSNHSARVLSETPALHYRIEQVNAKTIAPQPVRPNWFETVVGIFARIATWASEHAGAIVGAWALIAGLLLAKLAGGLVRLAVIKHRLIRLPDAELTPVLGQAGRRTAVCMSTDVDCPCVIGYLHPAVALPVALVADLDKADLQRVLAHELAHVRRWDDWANLGQQVLRAVCFFNPLVHFASRWLDIEREIACDDLVAAAHGERLEYAKCLTELARRTTFAAHLVPAAGFFPDRKQIVVRIEQLLDRNHRGSVKTGALPLVVAVVLTVAVLGLVRYQIPVLASPSPSPSPSPTASPSPEQWFEVLSRQVRLMHSTLETRRAEAAMREAMKASTHSLIDARARWAVHDALQSSLSASLEKSMRASALTTARVNALLAAKSAAFHVSSMKTLSAQLDEMNHQPSVDEFLDALSAAGFTHLSVDELVAVRNAGVSVDLLRELKKDGMTPMPIAKLIALANAGVDPDLARAGAQYLHARPSPEELVELAHGGVTAKYLADMAKAGYTNMSAQAIAKLADAGVAPGYVSEMAQLGYAHLSIETMIALANAGVTPAYVRSLAAVGYSGMSADTLTRMADAGVTDKMIKSLRAHGIGDHGNLSVDELIKLANAGF